MQSRSNNSNKKLESDNLLNVRQKKLIKLREKGNPFPNDFRRNIISNILHNKYHDKTNVELKAMDITVSLAGRMIRCRNMGKVSFVTLQDMGGKIQLYVTHDNLPNNQYYEKFKKFDIGDILGVRGKLFKTNTNELSVYCDEVYLLTKIIRTLPNKFHGLVDQEIRYRQRYLDLIMNEKTRHIFKTRSLIILEIRKFMIKHNFMEVETPMMHKIPGGATARPFVTHHNALNIDLYLRIAPELYLKQLVIGGFERIFEINRNFRNEGISTYHNPEFTTMEIYMAYADYKDLMIFIEDLFYTVTKKVLGNNIVSYGTQIFDFSKPFMKMTMKEAICNFHPKITPELLDQKLSATVIAESLNIKINENWGLGKIQNEIFKETVENNLLQPTFITEYPTEVSPLARCNDKNLFFTDHFELFIGGYEICNGFSELNDPEEQAIRFIEQVEAKNKGDNEAMLYDEDYITALKYGLPPTAGLGIGIDRLVMLLTNSHTIRDVIFFPILRSQK